MVFSLFWKRLGSQNQPQHKFSRWSAEVLIWAGFSCQLGSMLASFSDSWGVLGNSRALPLHFAAQGGQPGAISLLLEARATDLDSGRSFENPQHDGANPLFLAVESNKKESVELLLAAGGPGRECEKE